MNDRFRVAKITTYVNASVNTLLAIFKIIIGYFGHSSALIADGIHSFSDLITDALVLIAAKAGGKHPDTEHPYGHQRIETIAAIVISLIFIAVGFSIIYEAIHHLLSGEPLQKPSLAVFIVAIVSVFANEFLFRYTLKKGKSIQSNLLITNAWHNRGDVFVSLIVLISVGLTWLGLRYFDAIGAAIIALFIIKIGGKLIWSSTNELIDAGVDETTLKKIETVITRTPGVKSIHQLRTRLHGGNIFVDVHIQVQPKISVSEGHFIGEQVHLLLIKNFNHISDVTVHIDPEDDERSMPSKNLPPRQDIETKLKKCWKGLPGYQEMTNLQLHYLNGQLYIELEMPIEITKNESASALEKRYKNAANDIKTIASVKIHFIGPDHKK